MSELKEEDKKIREGVEDKFHVALAPYQCPFVPGGTCYGESCALWIKEVTIKDTGRVEVNRCGLYVLAVETLVQGRRASATSFLSRGHRSAVEALVRGKSEESGKLK